MRIRKQPLSGRFGLCLAGCVLAAVASLPAFGQSAGGDQGLAARIAERRDAAAQQADQPPQAPTPSGGHQAQADVQVGQNQLNPETGRVVAGDPLVPVGEELAIPEQPERAQELLPLGRTPGDGEATSGEPEKVNLGGGWVLNTMAALGVVIALILGLRWLAKRSGAVKTSVAANPAVEMLSRTTIAPRNHVVLLRVGPRVLVVNDSSQGMRTLANIDDPDEVAELLRSVQVHKQDSASRSFAGVMSRLGGGRGDELGDELGDDSEVSVDQARDSLAGLRGRISSLTGTARGGGS